MNKTYGARFYGKRQSDKRCLFKRMIAWGHPGGDYWFKGKGLSGETEYARAGQSASMAQTFIGPVGKYYFGEKQIRPFVFSELLFLTGDRFEGQELALGAGMMYHVSGNIGLNVMVKYGHILADSDLIDTQRRIFFGLGLSGFLF
jgi:hypothetical protein